MNPTFRPGMVFLLLACTGDGNAPTSGELLSHETFSGGLNGSRWRLQCSQTYSCLVLEENGNSFLRSTWRPWDLRVNGEAGKGHGGAELAERARDSQQYVNRDLWYKWRFRVVDLSALEAGLAGSVIVGQFHHQENSRGASGGAGSAQSPPIALRLKAFPGADDKMDVQLKLPGTGTHHPLVRAMPVAQRGQWHTTELHVFWSNASDGWVEWYFDGEPVLVEEAGLLWPIGTARVTGIRTLPIPYLNYFKIGQYVVNWADDYRRRETAPGQIVVDFDDIAIGTDRQSVNRESTRGW